MPLIFLLLSMVIDYLNIRRAGCVLRPIKTNPPLHVDADAELTAPVASQGFKAVAGQSPQVLDAGRGFQNFKAFPRLPVESLKLPDERAIGKSFGPFVAVAQNHYYRIAPFDDLRQA